MLTGKGLAGVFQVFARIKSFGDSADILPQCLAVTQMG